MKRIVAIVHAVILLLALCIILTGCGMIRIKSRESLIQWVENHRETWEEIISNPQACRTIRYDQEPWSRLFLDGSLDRVYCSDTGDWYFYFNGIGGPAEGNLYLIWSRRSAEEIAP